MSKAAAEIGTEGTGDQTPTIEETAKAQGWNPDYDGTDKIDAAEYVRRKPLFDRIKQQSKKLKDVEKLVEGMATTYKAMSEVQFKKGIAAAEAKMKDAEDTFDVKAFKEASAEKVALETAQATIKPTAEPAEVAEFCERNPWFEKSATMRTDALEYGDKFMQRNPHATIAEKLEYIETKIKKDYSDHFTDPPDKKKPVATVEGASPASHTDPLAKLKASMSSEEKRIMKMFVGDPKDGKMTEADYLKSYSEVRDR